MKQLFTLILLASLFTSCKKDSDPPPEVVISRDSLLVSHAWQVQQINEIQGSMRISYVRGSQNNSWNYDEDFWKFEKNGTGIYHTSTHEYDISWQFDNVDKTELSYTLHDYANGGPQEGVDLQIKFENIYLSSTNFRFTELYTNLNGSHTISSVYCEPKPGN